MRNNMKIRKLSEEQKEAIERLGWDVFEEDNGEINLQAYSPEGEDLWITIPEDEDICDYLYDNYNLFPSSISVLSRDAEKIEEMYDELFTAFYKADKTIRPTEEDKKELAEAWAYNLDCLPEEPGKIEEILAWLLDTDLWSDAQRWMFRTWNSHEFERMAEYIQEYTRENYCNEEE